MGGASSFSDTKQEEQIGAASSSGSNSMRKNEGNKIVPSASVSDYNVIQDNRPGNVYNMWVRFYRPSAFVSICSE